MKRIVALLLAAMLLCGCSPLEFLETMPTAPSIPRHDATQPSQTIPAETAPSETVPTETVPSETEAAVFSPYTLRLHAAVPILCEPTYDAFCTRIVEADGVYTIVEETLDAEGNRWGRLKSGAGWVDLDAAEIYTPVTAAYADDRLLGSGCHETFTAVASEYLTRLAFRAREPVTDVRICQLEPNPENWESYTAQVLYTCPALKPGRPLVAEVVFYGDMTAYGISCRDASGNEHHYAVTVSGRNGMLEVTQYIP